MERDDLPDLSASTVLDDRLRDVASDNRLVESAIVQAVDAVGRARCKGDRRAEIGLLGYLGNAYRVCGRVDEAVIALEGALRLAEELGDDRARVRTLVRLGEAYRCGDALETAEHLLRLALRESRMRAASDLSDFALQHLGKCLLDQGQTAAAITCLEDALELRRQKHDPALIASTELALDHARAAAYQAGE